jgi:hypothetical protein
VSVLPRAVAQLSQIHSFSLAAVGHSGIVWGYLANPALGFYLRSRTRRAADGGDASTLEGVLGSAMRGKGAS